MDLFSELAKLVDSSKVSINNTALESVSIDESALEAVMPAVLVYAESVTDIQKTVQFAYENKISITTRGAGSALEGSTIPQADGIVLDVSRMNQVMNFWAEDLQVKVQPGIIYDALNDYLKRESLFFPPAPGGSSDVATIGGMVSTNASGIYSVKYGGTKDYVLALDIIDGKGQKHTFGNRAVKRSSGYNLVDLMSGSEGTLGIITSITLKLQGIPEGNRKFAFNFSNDKSAAQAVSEMMRYGLDLAAVEFLDRYVMTALNELNNYGLEELPSLFLEIHGPDEVLKANQEAASEIVSEFGGKPLELASGQNPWEIRHHVTNAIKLLRPGYTIIRNDVAFPISKLPEMVAYCHKLSAESGLLIHAFGHVGMGLLHALILARRENKDEWQLGQEINQKIIRLGIELDGTISGEHGIGLGHKALFAEINADSLKLYQDLKLVFDPEGILNPGKIF